jgi:hypothetical protein
MRILIGLALLSAACSKSSNDREAAKTHEPRAPRTLLGIDPEKWECTAVVPDADVGAAIGGPVHPLVGAMTPPRGVPHPCSYGVMRNINDAGAVNEEVWTFDLDCRPDYEKRVELLFAQYAQQSSDQVSAYHQSIGSGKAPVDDAGVEFRKPEDAFAVEGVGRKALDHHGQGLLFVDDDSPCYVRVVGPGKERRLALAKLVAQNLHEANAPMPSHGVPVMK